MPACFEVILAAAGPMLLLLEPSAAGLLSGGWSPSRPLVFAAGSGEHTHFSTLHYSTLHHVLHSNRSDPRQEPKGLRV
jgi:hypothetical protein